MAPYQILLMKGRSLTGNLVKGLLSSLKIELTMTQGLHNNLEQILMRKKPDLVIVDSHNIRHDLEKLNKCLGMRSCNHKSTPFIFVGSDISERDRSFLFDMGASAYILNDEVNKRLKKVVHQTLNHASFCRERLILVTDNSALVRKFIRQGLEKHYFQVVTAENGRQALSMLADIEPDLILSAIEMPVMDGFTFCEALQADSTWCQIPFVVMSAREKRADFRRMINLGATSYIVKPFSIEELSCLIENILCNQFHRLQQEKKHLRSEKKTLLATITSLVSALEARDSYTRGHSLSVAKLSADMLKIAGGSQKDIRRIYMAGTLHDIGKIGIRDHLLLKPGKLTKNEFDIVMKHPGIGAHILSPIQSLSDLIPLVEQHHERFDGKGYPKGIRKDAIHPWARLTSVADTYDALTSNRPYRPALQKEKALQIIDDERGRQLCPDSVELFFSWLNKVSYKEEL
ncbi:MAG: response regulator [Desulfobulbaceae bacterium]|nr:response regulator [Desulfobulbaceae bacterium]